MPLKIRSVQYIAWSELQEKLNIPEGWVCERWTYGDTCGTLVPPQWVAEELSYDPLPLGDGAELHLDLEDVLQHIPPIPGLMVDLES